MNEQQQDKEFEAFLSGKSRLTRPYRRLGREVPPAGVDQRILDEARKTAALRRQEYGPRGGWLKPVALAATVLLSLSVVMKIVVEAPVGVVPVVPETVVSENVLAPAIRRSESVAPAAEQQAAPVSEQQLVKELPETKTLPAPSALEEITVTARKSTTEDLPAGGAAATALPVPRDAAFTIITDYLSAEDRGRTGAETRLNRFMDMPSGALSSRTEATAASSGESPAADEQSVTADETDAGTDVSTDPEALLREIARLDNEQERAAANRLLDDFLANYPEHPVSVRILAEPNPP